MLKIAVMFERKKLKRALSWHSINKKLQRSDWVCLITVQNIKVSDNNKMRTLLMADGGKIFELRKLSILYLIFSFWYFLPPLWYIEETALRFSMKYNSKLSRRGSLHLFVMKHTQKIGFANHTFFPSGHRRKLYLRNTFTGRHVSIPSRHLPA